MVIFMLKILMSKYETIVNVEIKSCKQNIIKLISPLTR